MNWMDRFDCFWGSTLPRPPLYEVVEKSLFEELGLVRVWRESKGLSQGVVAKKMGISQAAYSQMERPGARLRKKTLEKIAAALEIEV